MISKRKIRLIITDIRFWILVFFILRLIGITNAPLEMGHNWRQALTNMVARNFLEGDSNILYPHIDMAGNKTGIIGSEFPFFNYLIYLVSSVFGSTHWYGRLINLIVSSIGTYYFYLLIKKITTKEVAFNATLVFLSSLWFVFSRKIMPDTFSVALVIIGLYYAYQYIINGALVNLGLYFLFSTLGMLCKIPALSLISVIGLVVMAKEVSLSRKCWLFSLTGISVMVVSFWYFYWVPYLLETFHYQLYFTKGLKEGLLEILPLFGGFLEKFYFSALCSYLAFIFFIIGVFYLIKSKNTYLKMGIALITILFFVFILKTGAVFPLHSYYIIPFVPVMAFISGYGLSKFPAKYVYIPLILISLEGIANQQHDFFIKETEKYLLTLEEITQTSIPKNKLIVINGGNSPQEIYFSHRKGWTLESDSITPKKLIELKQLGASYLIIDKQKKGFPILNFPIIFSNTHFDISILQ